MIFSQGTTFGAYRILAPLGSGGMGEVYRARDNRLGREVALKVLREKDSEDAALLSRFDQEARAASSLNHPNIVVVYESGSAVVAGHAQPIHFLAMELIDGEPLTSRLAGEPLSIRRLIDIGSQIADGLARAHESGIVHRDLKPSNIFVTADGRVKILDFGLAKLRTLPLTDTESPTQAEPLTAPGVVVGTIGYMSPEQVRGETATPSSDQFSLGCVLYEMLTGRSAFARGSAADTISAILRDEPQPIELSNPDAPALLRWIVGRCLSKSPGERYASTRDLARDMRMLAEHLVESGARALPPIETRGSRFRVAAVAGVLLAAAAAGLLLSRQLNTPPPQPEFRRLTFRQGVISRALFAPNGSILYSASWERNPARSYLALSESSGIDRLLESEIQVPLAFSEDGSQVLVLLGTSLLSRTARGTLAWWPSLGGKARRILDDAGWADAAKRGRLLAVVRVARGERVLELRSADGELRSTLFRTSGAISFVRFSPDERQVAFIHHPSPDDDAGEVRIVAVDGSGSKPLTRRFERCLGLDWNTRSGAIWFSAVSAATDTGSALWTVTSTGKARVRYVLPGSFFLQSVSAAADRWLLTSDENRLTLSVRRNGEPPIDLSWFAWTLVRDISPDGKTVLFYDSGPTERTSGMWIRPIEGGDATRLQEGFPEKFSPDGQWVVGLPGPTSRGPRLVLVPVGAGRSRSLSPSEANISAPSFIDPRTLLFVRRERGRSEVWRMDIASGQARPLGAPDCDLPRASPSGTTFVCVGSADSRTLFIYFLDGRAGRKLYQVPESEEIIYTRWNAVGDRIFALTRAGQLLTVDAATGTLVHQEAIGGSGSTPQDRLIAAALDAEGTTQAYSVNRLSSSLYLATGLR